MPDNVSLQLIAEGEKNILFALFDSYQNELNPVTNSFLPPEEEQRILNSYWKDTNRFPYFIMAGDDETVGFVLVNDYCEIETRVPRFSIAEFYISPEYRRKGFGAPAAHETFRTHVGYWEVRVNANNDDGLEFWQKVIGQFADNRFSVKDFSNGRQQGKCLLFEV